jgi:hypothetical protein
MSEPIILTVFHAYVNNNDDILEAIRLKRIGYKFHVDRIDFEGTDRMALSESDRKEWDDISLEAWNNHGYINGKPDGLQQNNG